LTEGKRSENSKKELSSIVATGKGRGGGVRGLVLVQRKNRNLWD